MFLSRCVSFFLRLSLPTCSYETFLICLQINTLPLFTLLSSFLSFPPCSCHVVREVCGPYAGHICFSADLGSGTLAGSAQLPGARQTWLAFTVTPAPAQELRAGIGARTAQTMVNNYLHHAVFLKSRINYLRFLPLIFFALFLRVSNKSCLAAPGTSHCCRKTSWQSAKHMRSSAGMQRRVLFAPWSLV